MRNLIEVTLLACLALVPRGPALARQAIPVEAFPSLEFYLQDPNFVKELKLSPDQVAKARAASRQVKEKHRADIAKLQNVPKDELPRKFEELKKAVADETTKALGKLLKAEQIKRLQQLQLQERGLQLFRDPDVDQILKLTDDQKAKIQAIKDAAAKEQFDLIEKGKGDAKKSQDIMQKMAAIDKESLGKAAALLNEDQKKAWKDLVGELFDFKVQGLVR